MKKIICFYDDPLLGHVVYVYSSKKQFRTQVRHMVATGSKVLHVFDSFTDIVIL